MSRAGHAQMRPPFGFVIRALADAGLNLTELAERLGVTKQAAIKVVDEMEAYGFVERRPAPGDRRSKILGLTERGRGVSRAALATSHRIEDELRADLGDADVDAARRVLLRFVEASGGLDDVPTPAAPARCGEVPTGRRPPAKSALGSLPKAV